MTWLKKSEPTEAWEIEDEENIGDVELARQIREICNSADSAEAVSVLYYGPRTEPQVRKIDRYERAKKRAEKKIEQISDELLRDTAIYQVLNFCMKARDVENAEKLFHRIPRDGAVLLPLVRSIDRDGVSVGPGHGGWLCALPGRRLCCAAPQGGVALGSMLCASAGERQIG